MKLVIVSNRLPVSLAEKEGRLEFAQSPGGLASGLRTYLDSPRSAVGAGYAWVGWPGRAVAPERQAEVTRRCREGFSARPVFLTAEDAEGFYEGYCNQTLWPLFHYFPRSSRSTRAPGRPTNSSTKCSATPSWRRPDRTTPSGSTTTTSCCCRRCSGGDGPA